MPALQEPGSYHRRRRHKKVREIPVSIPRVVAAATSEGAHHPRRQTSRVAARAATAISADVVAEQIGHAFTPPEPTAVYTPPVAPNLPVDRSSPTSTRVFTSRVAPPTDVADSPRRLDVTPIHALRGARVTGGAPAPALEPAAITDVQGVSQLAGLNLPPEIVQDVGGAKPQRQQGAHDAAVRRIVEATGEAVGPGPPEKAESQSVLGSLLPVVGIAQNLSDLIAPDESGKSQDIFINPDTGKPDRRSNYASPFEQAFRQFSGTSPTQSTGENLLGEAETLGSIYGAGLVGKAAEAALAARTTVANPGTYAELAGRIGLGQSRPLTLGEKLAGLGTKEATATARAAAAAGKSLRRGERIGEQAVAPAQGVARNLAGEIGFAAKGRYVAAARDARRAARAERAVSSINPVTAAAIPGTSQGRALLEGTGAALDPTQGDGFLGNLGDTLSTTGRVIPASLTFPATVAADTVRSGGRAAQDIAALAFGQAPPNSLETVLDPLQGAGEEGLAAFVEPAKGLISGDPAQVQDVIQNQVGLFALPMAPRALGALEGRIPIAGRLNEALRDAGTPPGRVTNVGAMRRARQIVEGKPTRKSISEIAAEERSVATRSGRDVEREIEGELRQIPGYPSMRAAIKAGRKGEMLDEPGNLVNPLARFGISRDHPLEHLQAVVQALGHTAEEPVAGTFTMRDALAYAEAHPEVLNNEHLWNAVDIYKRRMEQTNPSERAARLGQAQVFGVPLPHEVTPVAARPHTDAKLKVDAEKDLADTRAQVKSDRATAKSKRREAKALLREAKVYELADSRRVANKVRSAQITRLEARKERWREKLAEAKTPTQKKLAKARLKQIDVDLASKRATLASKSRIRRIERAAGLRREAGELEAKAKADSKRATSLQQALDPYIRSGTDPSIRTKRNASTHPESPEVREFIGAVDEIAANHPLGAFEKGTVVSERNPHHMEAEAINTGQVRAGSRAPHISNFKVGRADIADRGIRSLIADSVYRPRMQAAIHRFITRVLAKHMVAVEVGGKKVYELTGKEAADAIRDKRVDPRETVFLPVTVYKRAIEQANFDPKVIHDSILDQLNTEHASHTGVKGDKYVALPREAAMELAAQLDPKGGGLGGLSRVGGVMSRLILMSPAWAIAQVVAEGLQAGVAVNPLRLGAAVRNLERLKKEDPEGYEAFAYVAGESKMAARTPHDLVPNMNGDTQGMYRDAGRALRRTLPGRAMHTVGTGQLFSIFDQYKTGKLRQAILAAEAHKGFNKFVEGLQGMTKEQDAIAQKLVGMSYREQLSYVARNPEMFAKHVEYLNDVVGNWEAFTRFERKVAPFLIFYPFLRMGLRWTFWSYPKHHPIKATMLYFLAQRNAEEIEKITGGAANFLSYAAPVVHGDDGKVDTVLPAGQRFGAPGLNSIVEAIGTQNVTSLMRLLNPAIGIPLSAVTGVNPLSGQQEVGTTDVWGHMMLGVQQLLTMPAPLRPLTGGSPTTGAQAKAAELDPQKMLRSAVLPILPQSAGDYAEQQVLNAAYRKAGETPRSEASQFLEMPEVKQFLETGDTGPLNAALDTVSEGVDARDLIKTELEGSTTPEAEARIMQAIDAYYAAKEGGDVNVGEAAAPGGVTMPTMPSMPTVPQAAAPTVPAMPTMPTMPGVPGVQAAPQGTYLEMLRRSAAGQ